MEIVDLNPGKQGNISLARKTVLWLLFFSFSLALGYPTLNRYDPRIVGTDQGTYYRMVSGHTTPDDIPLSLRVLVPAIAKPFYLLARGRVETWDPVWFGMLVSNSIFCATFSLLLALIGYGILGDLPLALLGCTFVLLNYAVPDLWLSGYVDASEGCLLMAVAYCMYRGKWWLLPLIGIAGGLAKQSFLPFATVFAAVWWLSTEKSKRTIGQILCTIGMAVAAFVSIVITYRVITGGVMMPWSMASTWWANGDYFGNLKDTLGDHRFGYPFFWLLPLGAFRLKRFPKPWVNATLVTGVFAFGFAIYTQLGGTVNRPMFNVIAPLFSLSSACLVATTGPWTSGSRINDQEL